ncbi:RNA-binding protein 26 [Fasciola hepatica]|uniref:RNA-binding protein 26 n=1 Tax=Fasciola hepatica TaxID=6192 RepID=A0A4E0R388_FASHE|nr:RNA-binding protein 26 [Fasciola hepatica]
MPVDYKSLESWLHEKLKPLCVADPIPLSQYVIALIKKDKPEKELREICIDQLEVFLQENTPKFVEDLFTALISQSYVTTDVMESTTKKGETVERVGAHSRLEAPKEKKRSVTGETLTSDSTAVKTPIKSAVSSKSRTARSRSRSPLTSSRTGANPLSNSRGRRGRDSSEREPGKNRLEESIEGKAVSSRNRREDSSESTDARRFRLRDPDIHRHRFARERYRSPDRSDRYGSRCAPLGRTDNTRDGGPRKRRCRNFEEHGVCAAGSRCPFDHGPHALVLPSTKVTSTTIVNVPLSSGHSHSRDDSSKGAVPTDQKTNSSGGFKSTEPHCVETTVSIPIVQSAGEPLLSTPDSSATTQTLSTASILPVYRPTPINHPDATAVPQLETFPFNPSLLSIPPPILGTFTWPTLNLPKTFASHNAVTNEFPRAQPIRHNVVPIPMREINPIHTVVTNESTDFASSTNVVPPAYEPDRPQITMISGPNSQSPSRADTAWAVTAPNSADAPLIYTPSPISERLGQEATRGSHTRGGYYNSVTSFKVMDHMTPFPSVLYVTKLPWKQNDVDQLHVHFAKFGTVLKIVPCFGGLADAAMVEFSSPVEAEAAYRSPEPILSNRFIRLSLNPPILQRLGGRPVKYEFRGKTLQDRLGVRNRLGSRPYGGLGLSYVGSSGFRAKPAKLNSGPSRGHSRFRLERDSDAIQSSPPASPDEADEPEDERVDEDLEAPPASSDDTSFIDRGFNRTKFTNRLDTEFTANNEVHGKDKIADASGVFGVELARARMEYARGGMHRSTHSSLYTQEAKDYVWECEKQNALKRRQEKLLSLDKAREAKQSALEAQKQLVSRLRIQLKKVMSQLEGKDEPPSAPSSTGGSGSHLSVTEQRRLLTEAKRIQSELEQALALEKSLTDKRSKPNSESDPNAFGSTTVSAAALQALPEPVATERRKQIAEVKVELKKVESEAALLKSKGEPVIEQRRRILELKRQLVSLETVRPSDFYGAPGDPFGLNYPCRTQTKLDKRPRTLFVSGLAHSDVDDFQRALSINYLHTQQVVKHADPGTDQPILEITFRTRDFAEAAIRQLQIFNGQSLEMSFAAPQNLSETTKLVTTPSEEPSADGSSSSELNVTSTLTDPTFDPRASHKADTHKHLRSPRSSPTSTTFATTNLCSVEK